MNWKFETKNFTDDEITKMKEKQQTLNFPEMDIVGKDADLVEIYVLSHFSDCFRIRAEKFYSIEHIEDRPNTDEIPLGIMNENYVILRKLLEDCGLQFDEKTKKRVIPNKDDYLEILEKLYQFVSKWKSFPRKIIKWNYVPDIRLLNIDEPTEYFSWLFAIYCGKY